MNKRILAAALALLCALTLCLTALPVFADGEGDPATTNVAAGATVTVSGNQYNNDPSSNWGTQFLVDGSKAAGGILLMPGGDMFAPVTSPIDITLDLGGLCTIYSVDLYDAYNGAATGNPFAMPEAYVISVSDDGVDFTPVATVTDGVNNVTQHTIPFNTPATGSYLRLTITKGCTADLTGAGQSFCAIGELEAQGVRLQSGETTAPDAGGSEESTAPDAGVTPPADLRNVANNTAVTVDGVANTDYLDNLEWSPAMLVDGIKNAGNGLLLCPHDAPFSEAKVANIYIDLKGTAVISSFSIYNGYNPASASLPRNYTIDYSMDNADWENAVTKVDGDNVAESETFVLDEPIEAKYLRIQITKGSGWDLSTYPGFEYLGCDITTIGELEAYGYFTEGGPVEETEPETNAPTPVIPNPNPGNNDDDETDPETETEVETEAETVAETVAETEAPKTETKAPETAAPAADTADEGCASVVGMGVVAILTAAAAAVVLKKKD